MSFSYLQVLNPVIGLIINASVQVFVFRCSSSTKLLKSLVSGWTTGFASVSLIEIYNFSAFSGAAQDFIAILITNLIIYCSLGYCYFHFINLGETARRVRILRELHDSKKGLSMAEILERYSAKDIIEKRINRLIDTGQIIYKNGRYYTGSPAMLLIAKIITTMKLIITGKR